MSDTERLLAALAKIAEVAGTAVNGEEYVDDSEQGAASKGKLVCIPKSLPKSMQLKAAETAVKHNPANQPALGQLFSVASEADLKLAIAVLTTKYWGPAPRRLTVSFLDSPAADLRRRIIGHMNAWNRSAGIRFVETQGTGLVRISRGRDGYWSYLGTDILHIARDRPTMNLQGFTMNTPESEYRRVIRHEAGHTLGFSHEHGRRTLVARIDPERAYEYFRRTQGWSREEVDQQVLTPLDERAIMGTPADQTSIMCYQLPGSITRDGQPILGGVDINQSDYDFAGRIYPKPGREPEPGNEYEYEEEVEDVAV